MSTFENCITAQFVAKIIYPMKPTFYKSFLLLICTIAALTGILERVVI